MDGEGLQHPGTGSIRKLWPPLGLKQKRRKHCCWNPVRVEAQEEWSPHEVIEKKQLLPEMEDSHREGRGGRNYFFFCSHLH